MIEFAHFIYLDVYRTGSTHTINILRQVSESKEIRLWRHAPITRGGYLVRPGKRLVFATVRNPWSWYVSLWAHGVDGRSAVRRSMLKQMSEKEILAFYNPDAPAESFRRWLSIVHDPAFVDKHLEERYPESRLSGIIGLYTYRFQRVTTRFPWFHLRRWQIRDAKEVQEFHHRRKAYQMCLRTETLSDDLARLVKEQRVRCRFKPDAAEILEKYSHAKRNASSRLLAHYRDYYDEPSIQLVATRDCFFLDEFGYRF